MALPRVGCASCSSVCFFFSSRRRHTRLVSDWSSDVCSSDLAAAGFYKHNIVAVPLTALIWIAMKDGRRAVVPIAIGAGAAALGLLLCVAIYGRSEERRVGEEGGVGGAREELKKAGGGEWWKG